MSLALRIGILGVAVLSWLTSNLGAQPAPSETLTRVTSEPIQDLARRLVPSAADAKPGARSLSVDPSTDLRGRIAREFRAGKEANSDRMARAVGPETALAAGADDAATGTAEMAADITEALLFADLSAYTAVYETILAGSDPAQASQAAATTRGNAPVTPAAACPDIGPEAAVAAASRAFFLRGPKSRYAIDAAVLNAAADIARAQRACEAAPQAAPVTGEQRAVEKERLRRMMEKGLTDAVYQDYLKERGALIETPRATGEPVTNWSPNVYNRLFAMGLVGGGGYDTWLAIPEDPGGYASQQ